MKIFKPSKALGILVAVVGSPFVFFGVCGVLVGIDSGRTWHDWDGYLFFALFGLTGVLAVAFGVALLTFRIEVDSHGITTYSWLGLIRRHDSWQRLKSWTIGQVNDREIEDRFFVQFCFEGRRWPVRFEASLVVNLGFREFLGEIRFHASDKEIPNAIAQSELDTYPPS